MRRQSLTVLLSGSQSNQIAFFRPQQIGLILSVHTFTYAYVCSNKSVCMRQSLWGEHSFPLLLSIENLPGTPQGFSCLHTHNFQDMARSSTGCQPTVNAVDHSETMRRAGHPGCNTHGRQGSSTRFMKRHQCHGLQPKAPQVPLAASCVAPLVDAA